MAFLRFSVGTLCVCVGVLWASVHVCLSTGGIETRHIKQPGTAVLSDVIESNEIQLSQRVLELRCAEQRGSM